jgi:hypothetical protein
MSSEFTFRQIAMVYLTISKSNRATDRAGQSSAPGGVKKAGESPWLVSRDTGGNRFRVSDQNVPEIFRAQSRLKNKDSFTVGK